MTPLEKLEGRSIDDSMVSRGDLADVDVDSVESGVLKDMLRSDYVAEGEYNTTSWSRTSYSRIVKPCRIIWP